MTVASENNKNTYAGDDATTVFAYSFRILDETHLLVQLEDAASVLTTQTLTTHYTVSGVGEAAGGNVTFVTAPTSDDTVVITRAVPILQQTDYLENDAFPAETHEEALDELTMIAQQQQEVLDRAIVAAPTTGGSFSAVLPNPAGHGDEYVRVNSGVTAYEYATITSVGSLGLPVSVTDGGTGSATGELALVQGSSRAIRINEETTGAGSSLTVAAGAAETLGTDLAGGTLVLSSGTSEGTGTGSITVNAAKAGSTGSALNSAQLVTTFTAEALAMSPHGVSAGNTSELRMLELAANGIHYTGFKAPDSLVADVVYTLPTADGSASQFLQTDGSTNLTFATVSSTDTINHIQQVYTQTGASATGTTTTPDDDTIPQNTEGDEYMTLAITPTDAASILRIEVKAHAARSTSGRLVCALFQDSTADALAFSAGGLVSGTNTLETFDLMYNMVAGTASATTFKVRLGNSNASTVTFNGVSGSRHYGGVLLSSIVITEMTP